MLGQSESFMLTTVNRVPFVYLNGTICESHKARISIYDRGFLYGDGVFETVRVYNGRPFCLEEHMERLENSARGIQLSLPPVLCSSTAVAQIIRDLLKRNGLTDATIRIVVTRGENRDLGYAHSLATEPTLAIIARPLPADILEVQSRGVRVIVSSVRRVSIDALSPHIKSNNVLNNILAYLETEATGAYEAIMLNHDGYVAEGTRSNVFIVKNGIVKTPPLSAGILSGVTRSVVMKLAGEEPQVTVAEELFGVTELQGADEVFLTHTTMEIVPVVQIGETRIGQGIPGYLTTEFQQRFRTYVQKWLGGT